MKYKNYAIIKAAVTFLLLISTINLALAGITCTAKSSFNPDKNCVLVTVSCKSKNGAYVSEYPRDFIILIDISKSMEEAYGGKIKIEHVKESIPRDFLNNIHAYKDRVGIVAFSDDVIVATTPVSNYEKVKDSIDKLNPSGFNSNIKDAMQTAITILKFKREKSIPILILITDGGKDESTVNEELIIKELKEEGITLYVFNIGEDSNVEDFLKRACNETGGFYRKIEPTTLGINLKEIAVSKETLSAANVKLG